MLGILENHMQKTLKLHFTLLKKLTRNGLKTNKGSKILKLQKKMRKVLLDFGIANKLFG